MNRIAPSMSRLSRTIALLLLCWCSLINAQVPRTLNYQGYLTSPSGAAINNPSQPVTIRIYDAPTVGNLLFTEPQTVTVRNGIFNLLIGSFIDLPLAFDRPYWLGVTVGTDPEMSPRQPLASSPYAIRSASSDSLAATSLIAPSNLPAVQLLPTVACITNQIPQWNGSAWICSTAGSSGATGTVTNVATGAGLTGGPISATGTIALAATNLLPTTACQPSEIPKWNGTAWACAADSVGSGTLTGVTATAPLASSGGPTPTISLSGVVPPANIGDLGASYIKNGTSLQPASSFNISGDGLIGGNVGIGVTGTGSKLSVAGVMESTSGGVKFPDGTTQTTAAVGASSGTNPFAGMFTTVDSAGNVGQYTSITVGADGLPMISYLTSTFALKTAKCSNMACTGTSVVNIQSGGGNPEPTPIAIGADGLALIGLSLGNGALALYRCNDLACSGSTVVYQTSSTVAARFSSIALSGDGLPIITYYDNAIGGLAAIKCSNVGCSTATRERLDGGALAVGGNGVDVGQYTSVTVGADGLPVMSYYDVTNANLKVAKCSTVGCGSASVIAIASVGDVGQYTSITVGADGLPVMSYYDATNGSLKVAKCTNAACVPYVRRR